jgi:hypothetical protein
MQPGKLVHAHHVSWVLAGVVIKRFFFFVSDALEQLSREY